MTQKDSPSAEEKQKLLDELEHGMKKYSLLDVLKELGYLFFVFIILVVVVSWIIFPTFYFIIRHSPLYDQ